MRRVFVSTILTLFMACVLVGCGEFDSDPVSSKSSGAQFEIISKKQGETTYGAPTITITVENVGSTTGYNVSCDIQAKKGNTIVDSAFAYFANGGNIDPGEKAEDEAIFFKLDSLTGYELEYELDWLER